MTKKLLTAYEVILNVAGLKSTTDGCVSSIAGDDPFILAGKRLVLPTADHLRNPSQKTMVFHPLRENVMRGESTVSREYRRTLAIRLNLALYDMIADLLVLAMTPEKHKNLNPKQSEILSLLKDTNKQTLDAANKIQSAVVSEDEKTRGGSVLKSAIKLYVKPSGKKNDKAFTRLGIVSFPIYADLKAGKDPHGVSMAKKHREILLDLYKYIFPEIDDENNYGYGSNSTVAPAFEAMFRSFLNVYQRLAEVIATFEGSGVIENPMKINLHEFTNVANLNLEELDRDAQTVPMQAGNEGSVAIDEEQQEETPAAVEKKGIPSPNDIRSRQEEQKAVGQQAYRKDPTEEVRPAAALPDSYRQDRAEQPRSEERQPPSNTVKFKDLLQPDRRDDRYRDRDRYDDRYDRRDDRRGNRERDFREIAYGRGSSGTSLDPYADDRRESRRENYDPRRDDRRYDPRDRDDRGYNSRRGGPGF